jgi:NAD(P)-dependent dehydrogenase (short-subunit alcohol dehydrogenase family)
MRFKDNVVIITGAARGIGRAIALGFAREGALLAVADISSQQVEETVRLVPQSSGSAFLTQADVHKAEHVSNLIETIQSKSGTMDVLVEDAGICPIRDILDMPLETWDHV